MKFNLLKGVLLFCSFFTLIPANAQYGIEVNYGLNGVYEPNITSFSHFGGGVTYDFDETYGLKVDFGFDKYRSDLLELEEETGLNITRVSIQGVVNISSAVNQSSSYNTFNLLAHAGAGYSLIKSTFEGTGNDNIVNVIAGLTPRFKISEGLYFAIDTSLIFNISQHYNFDGTYAYENAVNSFTGITYNVTGGIIYKFNEY
jgi:OOP family OmpA-OmpF porin